MFGRGSTKTLTIGSLTIFCLFTIVLRRRYEQPTDERSEIVNRPLEQKTSTCVVSPHYHGSQRKKIKKLLSVKSVESINVLAENADLLPGGMWTPKDCTVDSLVAVIIPYRDREDQLYRLLSLLFPILKRQKLNFRIILTEQTKDSVFNKGRIMNAAFWYARRLNVSCVIFHDVDSLPEDDRIPYKCPQSPMHLGGRVNTLQYELWYNHMTGGVMAMKVEDFIQVNGYSNEYWGWGGEDDDLGLRIKHIGMDICRPDPIYGTYTMFEHHKRKRHSNSYTFKLLNRAQERMTKDGLNSGKWKIVNEEVKELFHHILIDVGEMNEEWKLVFSQ